MCTGDNKCFTFIWITKQDNSIHQVSVLLHEIWVKSFGKEYIVTLKTIKKGLKQNLREYSIKVQEAKGSKRNNMKQWKKNNNVLCDIKWKL